METTSRGQCGTDPPGQARSRMVQPVGGLFVGVDGGTGDMEAVLVDGTGAIRGRGKAGPSNDPAMVGRMHPLVGEHVVDAVRQALRAAGVTSRDVSALSLNLSGDPGRLTREQAAEWLAPLELSSATVVAIEQDGLSAWAAGGFPDPAIWVLLGTNCGSEGMLNGRKMVHPLARVDLDAYLGQPVGAAVMGTWALGAAMHAQLGGPGTGLYAAYLDHLRVRDLDALVRWSREHTTSDERADLFPTLIEVATAGDPVASAIVREAAGRIADATRALARYMDVGLSERPPVAVLLAGKAWRAGPLRTAFESRLREELPGAQLQVPDVTQAEGAALLAMRHAGLQIGPDIFERL